MCKDEISCPSLSGYPVLPLEPLVVTCPNKNFTGRFYLPTKINLTTEAHGSWSPFLMRTSSVLLVIINCSQSRGFQKACVTRGSTLESPNCRSQSDLGLPRNARVYHSNSEYIPMQNDPRGLPTTQWVWRSDWTGVMVFWRATEVLLMAMPQCQ